MSSIKNVIQRNLPHTDTYKIVGSYYRSLEDGGGTTCANCGAFICNVAIVESSTGKRHDVGMDCANTLSGIKGNFDFEFIHKANFATAKSARRQIHKFIKAGKIKNLIFKTFEDDKNFYKEVGAGKWEVEYTSGGWNWKQYSAMVWKNYVYPMIKDLKIC